MLGKPKINGRTMGFRRFQPEISRSDGRFALCDLPVLMKIFLSWVRKWVNRAEKTLSRLEQADSQQPQREGQFPSEGLVKN